MKTLYLVFLLEVNYFVAAVVEPSILLFQSTGRRRQCDGRVYFQFVLLTLPRGLAHDFPNSETPLISHSEQHFGGECCCRRRVVLVDARYPAKLSQDALFWSSLVTLDFPTSSYMCRLLDLATKC
jgi:hypothetical protein